MPRQPRLKVFKIIALALVLVIGTFYLILLPRLISPLMQPLPSLEAFISQLVLTLLGPVLLVWSVLALVFNRAIQTVIARSLLSFYGLVLFMLLPLITGNVE